MLFFEMCLMLLGLLAGSTLAKGSPIKGVAMTASRLLNLCSWD
jgi:hypothetical protein